MKGFWDGFESLPMHYDRGDEMVCIDEKTGKELGRSKKTVGPNGKQLAIFETHPARTLRDIGDKRGKNDPEEYGEFFPKGTDVFAALYPGDGSLCIMAGKKSGVMLTTGGLHLGIDLEWR